MEKITIIYKNRFKEIKMERNWFYFVIIFLLCGGCSYPSQDNIKSIVVIDLGEKYYISEGKGVVYKLKDTIYGNGVLGKKAYVKEFPFKVSNKIVNKIKLEYYQNNFQSLPDDYAMLPSPKDKGLEHNQRRTTIIFYFTDRDRKYITFWDDGLANPLDRIPNKKTRIIFEQVYFYLKKVRDSTHERTEVPM